MANGDKNVEKETMEIFSGGKVAQLFDYRKLILTTKGKKSSFTNRFKQDKGHAAAWDAFTNSIVNNSESPIPFTDLLTSSVVSIAANESLIKKEIVLLKEYGN